MYMRVRRECRMCSQFLQRMLYFETLLAHSIGRPGFLCACVSWSLWAKAVGHAQPCAKRVFFHTYGRIDVFSLKC